MTSTPEIIVSYGDRGDRTCVSIGLVPGVELRDEEVDEATVQLLASVRSAFHIPIESRLTLHETETGRILSNETFRDPTFIPNFPRYWYLTVENGFTSLSTMFHSLSEDDTFPSIDCSDLLMMERYSPLELRQDMGDDDNECDDEEIGDLYPSLMELSMGHSPSPDGSREDLMTMSLTCDDDGDFGVVLRHFTVVANVPHSEHSSSESISRIESRSSTRSTDSFDILRMSTVFVQSVTPGGSGDVAGLQAGDIVYSLNGHSITGSTTEELSTIIDESSRNLIVWVSPEKHDDLLFLYPQYVNGQSGEFIRGSNEKITVADISVRTSKLIFPSNEDDNEDLTEDQTSRLGTLKYIGNPLRSSSIDYNHFDELGLDYIHALDTSSPLHEGSSNSLSSEVGFHSSSDDLLISASLADIPLDSSPVQQRKHLDIERISSAGLPNRIQEFKQQDLSDTSNQSVSQEWLSEQNHVMNGITFEWFPEADDRQYTTSLPGHLMNEFVSPSTELSSGNEQNSLSGTTTLAQKLKQKFKTLTGSSSNHRKLSKSNSLGITQTRSTSALDRLKVGSSSAITTQNQRSYSTDLGRIKLKRVSLEALTKVNSVENKPGFSTSHQKTNYSNENTHRISFPEGDEQMIPTFQISPSLGEQLSFPTTERAIQSSLISDIRTNHSGSFSQVPAVAYQLSEEQGKNLSGESAGSVQRNRSVGRSYRSERRRLHQTKPSRASVTDMESLTKTPSLIGNYSNISTSSRRNQDHKSYTRMIPSRINNRQNLQHKNNFTKPNTEIYDNTGLESRCYNSSFEESLHVSAISPTGRPEQFVQSLHVPLTRSHSLSETSEGSGGSGHKLVSSINVSQPYYSQQQRPHNSGCKQSVRKTLSVHPNILYHSSAYNDKGRGNEHVSRVSGTTFDHNKKKGMDHTERFVSVFHGPIHKKKERDVSGRKPSDRSWHSLYAAIQGHWMVFYKSVQDAIATNPLSSEVTLDMHQCVVTVLPHGSKHRKHVFRLSFVDGSECLIQSENEESMMRWMRIIHNLNRMRTRMGPPPVHAPQPRVSTQEDAPQKVSAEKRKIHRLYTPQPPNRNKEDLSRRQLLLEKLIRTVKKKDANDDTEVPPCYNTFGLPLEECPAAYLNKKIPLVVWVCIQELENNWLDTEGIYRVAGPIGQVKNLAQELNKGHYHLLQGHSDAHVITSILKKFLKELPNPLIPGDKYDQFIACVRDPEDRRKVEWMKELIDDLPSSHYQTLGFLMRHLKNVEAQSNVNKMNQHNLCIVFGPTVVRKEENDSLVSDMNAAISIVQLMMNNVRHFFADVVSDTSKSNDDGLVPEKLRTPFRRGRSDPTNYQDSRLQAIRKSWDGTYGRSLLSYNSQATDQLNPLSIGNEYSSSQDYYRPAKPHKKSRLARSQRKLTSHEEEPQRDLPSPTTPRQFSPTTSNVRPTYHSNKHQPRQRKISYNIAIQEGHELSSSEFNNMEDKDDEGSEVPFTHQSMMQLDRGSRHRVPQRHSISHSDIHKKNWSTTESKSHTEIVGPSNNHYSVGSSMSGKRTESCL